MDESVFLNESPELTLSKTSLDLLLMLFFLNWVICIIYHLNDSNSLIKLALLLDKSAFFKTFLFNDISRGFTYMNEYYNFFLMVNRAALLHSLNRNLSNSMILSSSPFQKILKGLRQKQFTWLIILGIHFLNVC